MITAKLRHLRISPRKIRLVANLIKGLTVEEAEKQLKFLTKRSAKHVLKLLNSAVANAKHNADLEKNNLYIAEIFVDIAPTLKRWRPRAMGRASSIMKRTSHLTIVLDQINKEIKKEIKKEPSKDQIKSTAKEEKKHDLLEEISQPVEKTGEDEKIISRPKKVLPPKPYQTTSQSKKKFFSRQTFGNAKKVFRRKSI